MRMPVFSYFIVMGTLLGIFLCVIGAVAPATPEIQKSAVTGLPRFKAEPESAHAQVTTFNFAAAYSQPAATKPTPVANARPRKSLSSSPRPLSWTQTAEYRHDRLTIH